MWPTIARASLVNELADRSLTPPARAQLISGSPGLGKSTVAGHVTAELTRRGKRVVSLVGVAQLRDVPAAALAPVLAGWDAGSAAVSSEESIGERVHRFVSAVGSRAADHVLAIDDASLLDDLSAGVVYQLVRVFGLPTIMTDRADVPLNGALGRLEDEGLVEHSPLPPLHPSEITDVLEAYLGGHVNPDSMARLVRASQGNPLVLREIVTTAEKQGGVHRGRFGVEIEHRGVTPRALDTARRQLSALEASQRELAEMLALSQPWPEALARRIDEHALDALLAASHVSVSGAGPRPLVRLAHPLVTEALLADLDHSRRTHLVRRAASSLRSTGDPDDRRAAIHLLPEDEVDADELEWAARAAASTGDFETALRLARAAEQRSATFGSTLTVAIALSALGEDAEQSFQRAIARAGSDADRSLATLRLGQHVAYRLRDPAAAVRLAGAALDELGGSAEATALEAETVKWRAMMGESARFEPADGAPSIAQLSGLLTEAMFATMGADVPSAARAIERGYRLAEMHRVELPQARSLLDLSQFLVYVASADIVRARSFAHSQRVDGDADAAGMWAYTLAMIEVHAGHAARARELSQLAVRLLEWRDFTGLFDVAQELAQTCAVLVGDDTAGVEGLAETSSTDIKVTLQRAETVAWSLARAGRLDEAAARVRAAVTDGIGQGHHLLASLTAVTAMCLGRAGDVVDLLERAAAESESALCRLLARVARARERGDYAQCVTLLPELTRAGMVALSQRLAEDAAERSRVPAVRSRARIIAAELAGTATLNPVHRASAGDGFLTTREWEVARAAAARRRSREIAEVLGVSVRTVDNHLASVYRKLGVSGRDELARLVTTSSLQRSAGDLGERV